MYYIYFTLMLVLFSSSLVNASENEIGKKWIKYKGRNHYISDMWLQAKSVIGNADIPVGCSGKTMIKIEDMSKYNGTLIVKKYGADLYTRTELTQFKCKFKLYGEFRIYSYDGEVLKKDYSAIS